VTPEAAGRPYAGRRDDQFFSKGNVMGSGEHLALVERFTRVARRQD